MRPENRIDYVEIPATDLAKARAFLEGLFGWDFQDWGDEYCSFRDGATRGGFQKTATVTVGGPLIVLYAVDLEAVKEAVLAAGGTLTVDMFEFPGGRRFHFRDPVGNELAVWTDNPPA